MDASIFVALVGFAFVSSITPGPNNMMLLASGANFGFRRTLPHMMGVGLGFTFMVLLVGIGIVQLFERFPLSYLILKWVSVLYLSYLAFKLAVNHSGIEAKSNAKAIGFWQAVLIQWINPKAWTMALTATSLYAPGQTFWAVAFVAAIFGAINLPSVSVWVVLGQKLQIWLTSHRRLQIFNYSMALLLLASVLPALL